MRKRCLQQDGNDNDQAVPPIEVQPQPKRRLTVPMDELWSFVDDQDLSRPGSNACSAGCKKRCPLLKEVNNHIAAIEDFIHHDKKQRRHTIARNQLIFPMLS